jgi:2-polyprenyl-6-methoxyphenol hydroxylase-like FAD-dependent oxidoreductase
MRIVIIGAGPTGLFTAIALARRGHDVVAVDRDPGPVTDGSGETWHRKGVMQFHQAHTFRGQVVDALRVEMPDVLSDLVAAGATVATAPADSHWPVALLCRRMVFERVLRRRAAVEPGVTLATGHVDRIVSERGRAVGVEVRGRLIGAELVIDATGRAARVTAGFRPPAEGGPCGAAYVGRQYRLRRDAPGGPVNSVIGLSLSYPGYSAIAFLHDNRTLSVTLVHDGTDHRLRELRRAEVFEAAVGEIPLLSEWIDPDRSYPITAVQPGGKLFNTYRGQLDDAGRPALPGVISVGDAVCTTTPLAGRGVALSFLQARELVRLLDHHGRDYHTSTTEFDRWCVEKIKPWFDDHCHVDAEGLRRLSGHDIDLRRPLPSDLIVAAAEVDPQLRPLLAPYLTMDAPPASLAPAEPAARQIYARGWRPAVPPGPTKYELAELCAERSPILSYEEAPPIGRKFANASSW